MSAFGDRRLLAGAGVALLRANLRYWPTIAPLVAQQLKRWEDQASNIKAPELQVLALSKLHDERFNAEVAATLATLAPKEHRRTVVEAIVAYEVMYDYLDGLTERPNPDPLASSHALYRAFTDAIAPNPTPIGSYFASHPVQDDGYLQKLTSTVTHALHRLPSATPIHAAAARAATRCAEAQTRAHAAPTLGTGQLEQWAASEAHQSQLSWQEFLAGAASSVLTVHALIAAAAQQHTTPAQADALDRTYLSICALSTMLDSLIDHQRDTHVGQAGYIRYYPHRKQLADDLTAAARRAIHSAQQLPDSTHHVMTLVGVAAYYISAPTATSDFARPVTQRVHAELEPLITPTLAVMRTWRAAKRLRHPTTTRTPSC
ncbi:MAG TPA: DUF2600 family protein [Solirubrobacteraceae bacterium]|jgi:tetraprenyl-beta-curcumene synthase|nr:DUF2600 family protein [Solirubrobacteraceae bacterium]